MVREFHWACLVFTFHLVAGQSLNYGLVGESISLKPEIKPSFATEILWKHNGDKVVEFNGKEEQVYSPYEDRVTLDWHSAELNITSLRYEDSGHYEAEMITKKLDRSQFKLKVIDKVPKPTITCEINDEAGQQATLMCYAETRQSDFLTRVEWRSDGSTQPGPNLTITLGKDHDDMEYRCTVSNPLTTETATFTAKECNTGNSSTIVAIICVGVVCLVVLVLVLVMVYCIKRQKGNVDRNVQYMSCFAKKDDVESGRKAPGSGNGSETREDERPLLSKDTTPATQETIQKVTATKDETSPESPRVADKPPYEEVLNNYMLSNQSGIRNEKENTGEGVAPEIKDTEEDASKTKEGIEPAEAPLGESDSKAKVVDQNETTDEETETEEQNSTDSMMDRGREDRPSFSCDVPPPHADRSKQDANSERNHDGRNDSGSKTREGDTTGPATCVNRMDVRKQAQEYEEMIKWPHQIMRPTNVGVPHSSAQLKTDKDHQQKRKNQGPDDAANIGEDQGEETLPQPQKPGRSPESVHEEVKINDMLSNQSESSNEKANIGEGVGHKLQDTEEDASKTKEGIEPAEASLGESDSMAKMRQLMKKQKQRSRIQLYHQKKQAQKKSIIKKRRHGHDGIANIGEDQGENLPLTIQPQKPGRSLQSHHVADSAPHEEVQNYDMLSSQSGSSNKNTNTGEGVAPEIKDTEEDASKTKEGIEPAEAPLGESDSKAKVVDQNETADEETETEEQNSTDSMMDRGREDRPSFSCDVPPPHADQSKQDANNERNHDGRNDSGSKTREGDTTGPATCVNRMDVRKQAQEYEEMIKWPHQIMRPTNVGVPHSPVQLETDKDHQQKRKNQGPDDAANIGEDQGEETLPQPQKPGRSPESVHEEVKINDMLSNQSESSNEMANIGEGVGSKIKEPQEHAQKKKEGIEQAPVGESDSKAKGLDQNETTDEKTRAEEPETKQVLKEKGPEEEHQENRANQGHDSGANTREDQGENLPLTIQPQKPGRSLQSHHVADSAPHEEVQNYDMLSSQSGSSNKKTNTSEGVGPKLQDTEEDASKTKEGIEPAEAPLGESDSKAKVVDQNETADEETETEEQNSTDSMMDRGREDKPSFSCDVPPPHADRSKQDANSERNHDGRNDSGSKTREGDTTGPATSVNRMDVRKQAQEYEEIIKGLHQIMRPTKVGVPHSSVQLETDKDHQQKRKNQGPDDAANIGEDQGEETLPQPQKPGRSPESVHEEVKINDMLSNQSESSNENANTSEGVGHKLQDTEEDASKTKEGIEPAEAPLGESDSMAEMRQLMKKQKQRSKIQLYHQKKQAQKKSIIKKRRHGHDGIANIGEDQGENLPLTIQPQKPGRSLQSHHVADSAPHEEVQNYDMLSSQSGSSNKKTNTSEGVGPKLQDTEEDASKTKEGIEPAEAPLGESDSMAKMRQLMKKQKQRSKIQLHHQKKRAQKKSIIKKRRHGHDGIANIGEDQGENLPQTPQPSKAKGLDKNEITDEETETEGLISTPAPKETGPEEEHHQNKEEEGHDGIANIGEDQEENHPKAKGVDRNESSDVETRAKESNSKPVQKETGSEEEHHQNRANQEDGEEKAAAEQNQKPPGGETDFFPGIQHDAEKEEVSDDELYRSPDQRGTEEGKSLQPESCTRFDQVTPASVTPSVSPDVVPDQGKRDNLREESD